MSGFTHEAPVRGATDTWLTPPEIIAALGPFDLDPCAAPLPRPWPTAAEHITWPDDGLHADWKGRVWCNPPYGPLAGHWLKRMAQHGHGTALVFARTETEAWQKHVWPNATAILFVAGRGAHPPRRVRASGVDHVHPVPPTGSDGATVDVRPPRDEGHLLLAPRPAAARGDERREGADGELAAVAAQPCPLRVAWARAGEESVPDLRGYRRGDGFTVGRFSRPGACRVKGRRMTGRCASADRQIRACHTDTTVKVC